LDTEYVVQGIPPTPLSKPIQDEYAKLSVKLEALYTGDDPFGVGQAAQPQPRPPVEGPVVGVDMPA
jgi:hypothetical protein